MKKLKLILLLQAFVLGALTVNAQDCPCDDGTAEYSVDCDGDKTNDACSTDDCSAPTVTITAGGGDIKVSDSTGTCSMSWDCSPSGGSGTYTYSWSPSTGSGSWTTKSFSANPGVLGEGDMTVTVTDSLSGKTGTDTASYHIHEQVEITTPTDNDNVEDTSKWPAVSVGGAGYTCPVSSNGCTYTFSATETSTHTGHVTISGEGNIYVVKAKIEAGYQYSFTSTTGHSLAVEMNPGQTYAMHVFPRYRVRSGGYSLYDCSGLVDSDSWTSESAASIPFRYEPLLVN